LHPVRLVQSIPALEALDQLRIDDLPARLQLQDVTWAKSLTARGRSAIEVKLFGMVRITEVAVPTPPTGLGDIAHRVLDDDDKGRVAHGPQRPQVFRLPLQQLLEQLAALVLVGGPLHRVKD